MARTPTEVIARMRSVSTSSPRLVWHGSEGRIELSGRVFDNWVAKSANLLVDELDATEATEVAVDLPPHWKTLALAFACWQVGAVVVLEPRETADDGTSGWADEADILLTARRLRGLEPPRLLVCVALGSLAMRWDGPLPRGAVDFAAEVRSHGDVYLGATGSTECADPGRTVLVSVGGRTLTASDLLASVTLPADAATSGPATVLLDPRADVLRTLAVALAVWQDDGALVIVEEGVPVSDRMLAGERVTGRLESS